MTRDLQSAFLPRFGALARERLARGSAVAQARRYDDAATVARDLHAIAGEAGLLGLASVVPLAREGEALAKRMAAARGDDDARALCDLVIRLGEVIDAVCSPKPGEGGGG